MLQRSSRHNKIKTPSVNFEVESEKPMKLVQPESEIIPLSQRVAPGIKQRV